MFKSEIKRCDAAIAESQVRGMCVQIPYSKEASDYLTKVATTVPEYYDDDFTEFSGPEVRKVCSPFIGTALWVVRLHNQDFWKNFR